MARTTRSQTATASKTANASLTSSKEEPAQLSSPPATPRDSPDVTKLKRKSKETSNIKKPVAAPKANSKRKRAAVADAHDADELLHNLGTPNRNVSLPSAPAKRARKSAGCAKKTIKQEKTDIEDKVNIKGIVQAVAPDTTPAKTPKQKTPTKKKAYGLSPGETPYPNWPHPTRAECKEVVRLLSSVHGKVTAPKTIPPPSLSSSGCGEVPSVLDALIRTRLSAATTNKNSSSAFAGLVKKFGVLEKGVGKGSVDWNKVRLAPVEDVFEAIKCGGLAKVKSRDIKDILQMVWEENQARREELVKAKAEPNIKEEEAEENKENIAKAEDNVISLDHLHSMSTGEAFEALTKYPGIGVKTASCVALFCLQRPSFAVDTHVFRLCQWLGWVPPPGHSALPLTNKGTRRDPDRDSTFSHCEVRIPDDMKYELHYLFIRHGKTCPRCRAITGENSEGWDKGCVIDHLVKRTGARKGSGGSPGRSRTTGKGRKKLVDSDEDEESVFEDGDEESSEGEMSRVGSDSDEDAPSPPSNEEEDSS